MIRFKDGSTTSLDLVPGREREDLLRHLRYFPGKEVGSVEEQVYDPEHPRRFRYVRREDIEGLLLSWGGTRGRRVAKNGGMDHDGHRGSCQTLALPGRRPGPAPLWGPYPK